MGIDPGSRTAGYAIVNGTEKSFSIVESGICKMNGSTCFFERLGILAEFFGKLAAGLGQFEVSIEALAYVKNVNSFAKLSQARGAIISAVQSNATGVFEYAPNLVKSTVSGYGHASKQSMQKSLRFSAGLSMKGKEFASHDESDAIAIALCHHFNRGANGQNRPAANYMKRGRTLKDAFRGRKL